MTSDKHFRRLEWMYHAAPTNAYYGPRLEVEKGRSEVRLSVKPDFMHAAGAVHGSVYFKLLDDAAFFAANSVVREVLVLTANFNLHFLRPVSSRRAAGRRTPGQCFEASPRCRGGALRRPGPSIGPRQWQLHAQHASIGGLVFGPGAYDGVTGRPVWRS